MNRLKGRIVLAAVPIAAAGLATTALALGAAGPTVRAGWWEMNLTGGGQGQALQMCLDDATAKTTSVFPNSGGAPCANQSVRETATGYDFTSTCNIGGQVIMTTATATGDFQTSYQVEVTSRRTPAPTPTLGETHSTMEAKWSGACPSGRAAGDIVVNGKVVGHEGK